jgi:hypothetical protein
MKKFFLALMVSFSLILPSIVTSADNGVVYKQLNKSIATDTTLQSMLLVQTIIKGYLYSHINNNTLLDKKMQKSIIKLDHLIAKLGLLDSNDEKIQMCLSILPVGFDELKSTMKEVHSSGNDQLILDLATVITKAVIGIAQGLEKDMIVYKKSSNTLNPVLSSL